jgi:hypothetical protein
MNKELRLPSQTKNALVDNAHYSHQEKIAQTIDRVYNKLILRMPHPSPVPIPTIFKENK